MSRPRKIGQISTLTNDQIVTAATGRWGEVAEEIKPAEPYVIDKPDGSQIVILPLTRRRRRSLKASQAAYMLAGSQLSQLSTEETSEDNPEVKKTIVRIEDILAQAERNYDTAVFGEDVVDEVYDYFDDLQEEFWDAFYEDVHKALVNRVQVPEGTCPKCGHVDEEEVGKDASSSTSSNDSSTKLKVTSAAN